MGDNTGIVVVMGVCQTDFYNHKMFESIGDGNHKGLKLYREGKCEYVGIEVELDEKGRVNEKAISKAFEDFNKYSFGKLREVVPKLFQLGGK